MITIDGNLTDWLVSQRIDHGDVLGYSVYAQAQGDYYVFAISTPVAIGANTTAWFNTDLNAATGFQIFGNAGGAEYNLNINADGTVGLYTGDAGQTLVLGGIQLAYSADQQSIEFAIPKAALGNPSTINTLYDINNSTFLPASFSSEPYVVHADLDVAPTHRVAIVYSGTSASLYFSPTAYSDLFMAAQNQARMAGVSFDVIDESQLTDINNLVGYDALIFPSMANVNAAQLPAIMSTLTSAVYNYHIGIITSGDFLTNDQTGVALLGNSYANMQALLGLGRVTGGSGDITVTANDVGNPIMDGYTAGQTIQSYDDQGYNVYQSVGTTPATVLVNQNVVGIGALPGVVETTTGGTNVHFATASLLGDSNLLSNAIQGVVLGSQPGVSLHTSRHAGIMAARVDMDQAQNPTDVSPTKIDPDTGLPVIDPDTGLPVPAGPGIYDTLIPILAQWKQAYNFVGSYYVDIGDQPGIEDATATDWTKSLPYYQAIEALGSEIGSHSYTHLISAPATTFTATTTVAATGGAIQLTLDTLPAFAGVTVGMVVSGLNIGSTTLPSGAVAPTMITAVSGNTITLNYVPGGYGTPNVGVLGNIAAGTTLTFSVPVENTNFLQTGTGPFTYDYEFNQSKLLLEQQLRHPIYGAAVPGAPETYATAQNILAYYQSTSAYTGYVSGGWTGIGAGYPSAFGYMSPTNQGSVYIAPNVTFDFTEIEFQGDTLAKAAADWAAQFATLTANAAGTPILVWPFHDYGAADWNTTTNSPDSPLYTTQLFADFIADAYAANYEFVTLAELASRLVAQQKAHINYTTVGNTITATVTPDPTAPVGEMALDVINEATGGVIQNVTNWYAYNSQELFLDRDGGTFTINLGTVQDDVTHIAALPMRGDLVSVTGDGFNLNFSIVGEGNVLVDLAGTATAVVTGASTVSQVGDQLTLGFTGPGQHDVAILLLAHVTGVAFSADSGASATDFITNVATQTISGTLSGPLGAGDVVKVSLDNGATWLTATAAPAAMTFSLAGVTLTGSGTLLARVENAAGAFTTPLSQAYTLDQGVPAAPAIPDLDVASDSGVSGTDNNTNVKTPTFTGTAEAGSTVTLFDGASLVGTAVATDGTWSIAATTTLLDGVHSLTAKATDLAGNPSVASAALPVTIDTVPPAVPSAPNLTPESDTGVRPGDNITAVTTPTFTGTAQAGSTVTLYDGETAVGSAVAAANGKWTATATTLAGGVHSITAKAADLAGNISAASTVLAVTIQTEAVAPAAPDLVAGSDTGALNTDNVTKTVRPDFTGTVAPGAGTVTLYDGTTVLGAANANATTGKWTITATKLADGVHNFTTTLTDKSGNVSPASPALAVTIDTVVPAAPSAPDLTAESDTGVSNTDNITGNKTPTFAGTAEAGSTVTLYNGTAKIGTAVADATTGAWSIISTKALANGAHSITTKATDVAGNVSVASGALSITIDGKAPAAPRALDLTASSDTGASTTDNITSVTTPTFTGTAEVASTVTLYDGTTAVGSGVTTAAGTWSIIASSLTGGAHSITAKAADALGNVSAASNTLAVSIDAVAPNAPAFTGGTASKLSGTGEAGAMVTVLDGTTAVGTATVNASGAWNWSFINGASARSLTAMATDKAGNKGASSSGSALFGTSGTNTLTDTAGSDLLVGGGGADTFVFGATFGLDVIADFAVAGTAHDTIRFQGNSVLNSFANVLANTTQVGTGVMISDGSNTLTLNNVTRNSLTAVDFTFA